jgi:hypothetical protein
MMIEVHDALASGLMYAHQRTWNENTPEAIIP